MLPNWMKIDENRPGVVDVDADGMYTALSEELKAHPAVGFDGTLDQYWLEVIHHFAKLEVQFRLKTEGKDPRPQYTLVINISGSNGYKERWGQKNYPEGRFAELTAQHGENAWKFVAGEARQVFKDVRGFLPA